MLKNIEKVKEKGIPIRPEFLRPDLYSFQIPLHILKGLGLPIPGERLRRNASRTSKRSTLISQATLPVNNIAITENPMGGLAPGSKSNTH